MQILLNLMIVINLHNLHIHQKFLLLIKVK